MCRGASTTLWAGMEFNVFDSIMECVDYLESVREDDSVEKSDVLDSLRMRMSIMISRCILPGPSFIQPAYGWTMQKAMAEEYS